MAFGIITVKNVGERFSPRTIVPPQMPETPPPIETPPTPVQPPAPQPEAIPFPGGAYGGVDGSCRLNIALIAGTATEAEDYIAGIYYDLTDALAVTSLTVFVNDSTTINRIAEVRQDISGAIQRPVGTVTHRTGEGYYRNLNDCVISVCPAGQQSRALEFAFKIYRPGDRFSADGAIAIVNCENIPSGYVDVVRSGAGQVPLYWLLTGFERTTVCQTTLAVIKPAIISRLRDLMPSKSAGDKLAFAQVYGGLLIGERSNDGADFMTHEYCRDYIPAACHVPVIALTEDIARRAGETGSDSSILTLWPIMRDSYSRYKTDKKNWTDRISENGGVS